MNKKINFQEVSERLNIPLNIIAAYANAGFFGYFENNEITESVFLNFKKHKTYWPKENENRTNSSIYRNDSDQFNIPNVLGGIQPPSSLQEIQISNSETFYDSENDTGWIVQFFLRPNMFFFPNPEELTIIGPVGIKLDKATEIIGTTLPCYICPDSNGHLAMIMVEARFKPEGRPFLVAQSIINPILDELAFKFDQPLLIAQHIIVGLPSGTISINIKKLNKTNKIENGTLLQCPYPELIEATSLYREAISSNNPFHQFITFWKVYENVCFVRGRWRKKLENKILKFMKNFFRKNIHLHVFQT